MTLIGQHTKSGDYFSENSREGVKNGNVDKIKVAFKNQKVFFFLKIFFKTKNMESFEIQFRRAPCFLFLINPKKIYTFWFLNAQNPGNQYCLEH